MGAKSAGLSLAGGVTPAAEKSYGENGQTGENAAAEELYAGDEAFFVGYVGQLRDGIDLLNRDLVLAPAAVITLGRPKTKYEEGQQDTRSAQE
jgi:hypothetical protein